MSKRVSKTTPNDVEFVTANPDVPVTPEQITALAKLLIKQVTKDMTPVRMPDGSVRYLQCDDVFYVEHKKDDE